MAADIKITTVDKQGPQQRLEPFRGKDNTAHVFTNHAGNQRGDMLTDGTNSLVQQDFFCRLPGLVAGPRCYLDAAIAPDSTTASPRTAGLGTFYLDPQRKIKFYIKARIQGMTSVLMAEAAAINLAAKIATLFVHAGVSFFTDNQHLASFFNGGDHETPPQWEIKPFTQSFLNVTQGCNPRIYKIPRELNKMAHILATQAIRNEMIPSCTADVACSNTSHILSCPLRVALNSVSWECFSLVAAACC